MEQQNKIVISCKDGKIMWNTAHPMGFEDLLYVFCTVMLGAMRKIVREAPEGDQSVAKGALYDIFNVMASRVLKLFAPEYELRPGLTAKAIKEAEDKIIMENRLNEVQPYT